MIQALTQVFLVWHVIIDACIQILFACSLLLHAYHHSYTGYIYRICSNISPGFYFLPGPLETQRQNETGLYSGLASIKYLPVPTTRSTRKWPYKPHNWQFPWMFRPSAWFLQLRNVEKAGLQIATVHEHSLRPRKRLATPLCNVKYVLNCHAHSWHPAFIWDPAFIDLRAQYNASF